MADVCIYLNAVFFLVMGLVGLAKPAAVTSFFALPDIPTDMRNEVRAVYGGFGLALAGLLSMASGIASIRSGVLIAVAVALFGMAFGRLVSFSIERTAGPYPILFLCVEVFLGGLLLYAWSA